MQPCARWALAALLLVPACTVSIGKGDRLARSFQIDSDGSVRIRVDGKSVVFDEHAEERRSLALDLRPGEALVFAGISGNVSAAAGASARLVARLEVVARTAEEARALLQAVRISAQHEPAGLVLRVIEPEGDGPLPVCYVGRSDFELELPAETPVSLSTSSGTVAVRGALGACRLTSGYGDVSASGVRGELEVKSSSGDVELADLSGARVLAQTSYGDVVLRGATAAGEVQLQSSSGEVRVEDVRATALTVKSSYGDLTLERIVAAIDARTSSGSVDVRACRGASLRLVSGYGDIRVRDAVGELDASTSSGAVRLTDVTGGARAVSSYGDVELVGVLARVLAKSSSGDVLVDARPGSRVEREWTLESGYGDVVLALPSDACCRVEAHTGYGSIVSRVPGLPASREQKKLVGAIGRGGELVALTTSSGDVELRRSDVE